MSDLPLTLGWVRDVVVGRLRSGDPDVPVGDIVTDSRTLRPGDLFVALSGARFDGHTFVDGALRAGACGAIVERGWHGEGAGAIEVADTLRALQDLAHGVRVASETRVVAITGSAGKTTTKEMIAEFLGTRFRVVRNKGNLNNHIGLPLSLLQLRGRPDVAVMELGMNHAGEIRRLVEIADPEVRVWTNVGDAHLGFFDSADAIADAKAEILEDAGREDLLVCNADDARVMARATRFAGRMVTFGFGPQASVRATDVEDRGLAGVRARMTTTAGDATVTTRLLGRGNLLNLLAASAVALEFGVSLDTVAARASLLEPAERRGTVHRLRNGAALVDDSYNSSPAALRRALEVVASESGVAGKIAVLGEMLELGAFALPLHETCGRLAAGSGLRLLVAVGGAPARAMAEAAVAAGMAPSAVVCVPTSPEAAPMVARALRPGELVLVKGSRGIRTDLVVDRILAEFA